MEENKPAPINIVPINMIFDEFAYSPSPNFLRLASYTKFHNGMAIGERFNDRFDTLVGGVSCLYTQSLEEGLVNTGETVSHPALIVDYANNQRVEITPEQAESMPECAEVLQRLKERMKLLDERNAENNG